VLQIHPLHGEDRKARQKLRLVSGACRAHRGEERVEEGRCVAEAGADDPFLLGAARLTSELRQLCPREELLNGPLPLEGGQFEKGPKGHLALRRYRSVPQKARGAGPAYGTSSKVGGEPRDLGAARVAYPQQIFLGDVRHFPTL
jgi:hypothetical protein